MTQDKEPSGNDNEMDWDHRILCSDESCIGIIGMNGRCKECGKVFKGKLPENFGVTEEDKVLSPTIENSDGENLLDAETQDDSQKDEVVDELSVNDPEWEKRILCGDEKCIGVIGPDGLCKECGKPYEGNQK